MSGTEKVGEPPVLEHTGIGQVRPGLRLDSMPCPSVSSGAASASRRGMGDTGVAI